MRLSFEPDDEPLPVKQAGGRAQLPEKYGYIKGFRLEARRVLSRKCVIYAKGCRKRGRDEEAGRHEVLAASYRSFRENEKEP